ncbi:MAG TPA: hypothetical protein VFF91_02620 [Pseudoxanthomonas sp.]|nr:hypothetical protein [Pseudoxanthomonas sp.]
MLLDQALLAVFSSDSAVALVLPTTDPVFTRAMEMRGSGQLDAIVGSVGPHSISPASLLERLDAGSGIRRVAIFSDQLVSALDAPILVAGRSGERYLSSIELALQGAYGFDIHIQGRDGLAPRPAEADPVTLLRRLYAHLDDCMELGSQWLAGELQEQRLPESRARERRVRMRMLQSAVMHMTIAADGRLEGDPARICDALAAMYRNSTRAQGVPHGTLQSA